MLNTLKLSTKALTLGSIILVFPEPTFSQVTSTSNQAPNQNPKVQKAISVPRPKDRPLGKQLDKMVELPGMPSYSGKITFVGGGKLEGEQATSYRLMFYAKESPAEVETFYKNVFSMYKWTVRNTSSGVISAKDAKGDRATISIAKADKKHADQGAAVCVLYSHPN